ncbi:MULTISPECIES: peptidoglycan-binding domain-containing protein [Streptomyces]|uniref:Peptidoglycan-binding protein n=1 Tax=Streptomyces ehimensis TaxID=68195 RepID=A0ABV9BEI2_9ACTN
MELTQGSTHPEAHRRRSPSSASCPGRHYAQGFITMVLRCPRFAGDPVLEACLAGTHRMFRPEQGLAVKRVQAALIALGRPVGPAGDDGFFGPDTGAAVSAYKDAKGLSPDDPVVGKGTMGALDDDLFVDPPTLDPAFKEFSPFVVDRRLEPFAGLELAVLIDTPLNSWRHMLGRFTLDALNSSTLLGIVAMSRSLDLRDRFLAAAAPTQPNGTSAADFFDDALITDDAVGRTVTFQARDGTRQAFVLIKDDVILGRQFIVRTTTGGRARVSLQGVLVHELTHVRNRSAEVRLLQTPDTDGGTYVDTALAQARSATGRPTAQVLDSFVGEICARHVHWIVVQEAAGNPFAPRFLPPGKLAEAVRFYAQEVTGLFDSNGYLTGIVNQGRATLLQQLSLWLQRCREFSLTDDPDESARTDTLFADTADACARGTVDTQADGLFPLPADFTE